jgi:hypothetical protein
MRAPRSGQLRRAQGDGPMGARNVARAYALGAGLSDRSMRALAYMALRSVDDHEQPWFRQGHETIAVEALGREPAPDGDDPEATRAREANARAVQRAVTPLLARKILVTAERGARHRAGDPSTAKYLLRLDPNTGRQTSGVEWPTPDAKRRQHRTPNDRNTGRQTSGRGIQRKTEEEPGQDPGAYAPPSKTACPSCKRMITAAERRAGWHVYGPNGSKVCDCSEQPEWQQPDDDQPPF